MRQPNEAEPAYLGTLICSIPSEQSTHQHLDMAGVIAVHPQGQLPGDLNMDPRPALGRFQALRLDPGDHICKGRPW